MADYSVSPNSTIYLLNGIDIDKSYSHTLFSKNATEQEEKFFARDNNNHYIYIKHIYPSQYYQRVNKHTLRIKENANSLYDCSYLIFKNVRTGGSKMFYAFIDEVNYINENVTEIVYTIDIMQSYMFDYTLGKTFVEREHTKSDKMFEHIKPDIESTGEFVYNYHMPTFTTSILLGGIVMNKALPNRIVDSAGITFTFVKNKYTCSSPYPDNAFDYSPANVGTGTYVYTGFVLNYMDIRLADIGEYVRDGLRTIQVDTSQGASTYIMSLPLLLYIIAKGGSAYDLDESNVLSTFTYPADLATNTFSSEMSKGTLTSYKDYSVDLDVHPNSGGFKDIDNTRYVPKNNKCYTYQYNRIYITDNNGNEGRYACEVSTYTHTTSSNIDEYRFPFRILGVMYLNPQVIIYPKKYLNRSDNYDYGIIMQNFNDVPFLGNYYNTWYNQNKSSIVTGFITSAIKNIAGGITGVSSGATGDVETKEDYGSTSDNLTSSMEKGAIRSIANIGTDLLMIKAKKSDLLRRGGKGYIDTNMNLISSSLRNKKFDLYIEQLRPQYIKSVDDFFTMYGYNISELKVPNIYSARNNTGYIRSHWNYIKTANCDLHNTTCPCSVKTAIENIYNNGITFWNNLSEMGDYNYDNTTVI